MANAIGAYSREGTNDIGAYEYYVAPGGNSSHHIFGGPFAGPFAGPFFSMALIAILLEVSTQ